MEQEIRSSESYALYTSAVDDIDFQGIKYTHRSKGQNWSQIKAY